MFEKNLKGGETMHKLEGVTWIVRVDAPHIPERFLDIQTGLGAGDMIRFVLRERNCVVREVLFSLEDVFNVLSVPKRLTGIEDMLSALVSDVLKLQKGGTREEGKRQTHARRK